MQILWRAVYENVEELVLWVTRCAKLDEKVGKIDVER